MANTTPSMLVAIVDHAAVVKVNGRANFATSVCFKRLFSELRQRGIQNFILDLGECVTMDSTFLGVLASTALKLSEQDHGAARAGAESAAPPASPLRLLNPNSRVSDLLENLGVSDLFRTVRRRDVPVSESEMVPAQDVPASREELSQTCLEAHQVLMQLNPENVSKFTEVTRFLAEDLKKITSASADGIPPKPAQSGGTEQK